MRWSEIYIKAKDSDDQVCWLMSLAWEAVAESEDQAVKSYLHMNLTSPAQALATMDSYGIPFPEQMLFRIGKVEDFND